MIGLRLSMMRHREPDVRSYAVTHTGGGSVILPGAPGWDQFIHASSGVMTVHADSTRWVVTPERAVWVPDGVQHRIDLLGSVRLRTLYLRSGLAGVEGGVRALRISPLLRELVLHVVGAAPLWLTTARDRRLVGVLIDQILDQESVPLRLPWPVDERARTLAAAIVASPSATIAELAPGSGGSVRTLERLFVAETSLTPQRWRRRARLLHATTLLARGWSVTDAAIASGYSTPSAFTAAFRSETGTTPTLYLAGE